MLSVVYWPFSTCTWIAELSPKYVAGNLWISIVYRLDAIQINLGPCVWNFESLELQYMVADASLCCLLSEVCMVHNAGISG